MKNPLIYLALALVIYSEFRYFALADIRRDITVFPYTSEQRTQLAKSTKKLFSVYVNRNSKIAQKHEDPQNNFLGDRLDYMIENAAEMKDIEFHYKFVDIFKSLRDVQTTYSIPGAHSCITAVKPFKLEVIGVDLNEKVVVTNDFSKSRNFQSILPPLNIDIGDELISIDGVPIKRFFRSLKFLTGGATVSGVMRNSLAHLSRIEGRTNALPLEDENVYLFRSSDGSQEDYKIVIPWVVHFEVSCWDQATEITELMSTGQSLSLNSTGHQTGHQISSQLVEKTTESYQLPITWSIHRPGTHNMGVIYLNNFQSFGPEIVTPALELIRSLLLNELRNTKSVMFDVRKYSGGSIDIASKIPQLFATDIQTLYGRGLATDLNQELFKKMSWDDQSNPPDANNYKHEFTPFRKFTTDKDANLLGQAYVNNPIGVFTSGSCISVCEVFVANMKDNGIATIFGVDKETGGGGSSPLPYNTFLDLQVPEFTSIPYQDIMPTASQELTISWRQFTRIDGSLIEGIGIKSKHVFRPEIQDVVSGLPFLGQYDKIATALRGKLSKDGLTFEVSPQMEFQNIVEDSMVFKIRSRGYRRVSVTQEFGKLVADQVIFRPATHSETKLSFQSKIHKPSLVRYNIRGMNLSGQTIYSTWRIVKYIPKKTDYLILRKSWNINFGLAGKYAALYETSSRAGQGWNQFNGSLLIGNGIGYRNDIDSRTSFFIASKGFFVKIDAEYEIQQSGGILQFGYTVHGLTTHFLKKSVDSKIIGVSGIDTIKKTFWVPPGNLELFIHFKSFVSCAKGHVTIRSISLESK